MTDGLRGASDNSMWVAIAAPGVPGGAFLLSDQDIHDCLDAVGIKTPIQQLRLSGHSRGGDSLVASIVQKRITSLSKIDHIFILDATVSRAAQSTEFHNSSVWAFRHPKSR